ncbi:acireductone synthase [Emcibacter sp. SYSU 3D8]|uniref:acireductone synthase n=1 Tax=Emcibacter sp. SYSU 3D8 TaxID=3133969 RepID=UPI0031FE81DC
MPIRAVLTDIEGTTTSVSFVYDVLFPYARDHIPAFVRANAAALGDLLADVRREEGDPSLDIDGCIAALLRWMDEDRKVTPLKTLQGMVWKQGYEDGGSTGHLYPDVAPTLRRWKAQGLSLHVYSSGSVAAQKLLFGYSDAGDLTPLFSGWFDTRIGAKKDAASYARIAGAVDVSPQEMLFLSDNPEELAAARAAGLEVAGLERPGNTYDLTGWPSFVSFELIDPLAVGFTDP